MVSSVSLDNTGNMTVGVLDEFSINPSFYGSLEFSGGTDYLTTPSNAAFAFATGDFTLEAWVYRTDNNPVNSTNSQNIFDFRTAEPQAAINLGYDGGNAGYTNKIYYYINGTYYLVSTTSISLYTWYHVAVVRSGSTATLYINGTAEASYTTTINATQTTCRIGGRFAAVSGDYRSWQGYISNVRIVKGTAVYTSNFTPSKIPLTAITNTSLLLKTPYTTEYLKDSSTNAFTVTNSSTTSSNFTPFMPDGHYSIKSVTGSGGDVWQSGLGLSSATAGSAFNFGTGDFAFECWIYRLSANERTIDGATIFATTPQVANKGTLFVNTTGILICRQYSNGKLIVYIGGATVASSTTSIDVNTWYHIAYVRNSGTGYLYINGVLEASHSSTTNYAASGIWIGRQSRIDGSSGATYQNPDGYYCWSGYISNARVVSGSSVYSGSFFSVPTRPLTAISGTQLLACQSANIYKDNSTNQFTLVGSNDPTLSLSIPFTATEYSNSGAEVQKQYSNGTVQVAGVFDEVNISPSSYGSLSFTGDGSYNNYLSFPASTNWQMTGDFTIECWAYFNSFVGYNSTINPVLFDQYSGGSTGAGNWQWYFTTSGGGGSSSATFVMYYDGSSTFTNTTTLNINTWYHLAVTRSGSTIRMFINGVLQPTTATFSGTVGRNDTLWFGAQHSGISYFFNGYMSNARIVNGTALYTSTFTPSTSTFTYLLTAVTNTTLLLNTKKPNPFSDSSVYNATATIGGNGNVTFSNTALPTLDGNYTGYPVSKLLSTGNLQVAGRYNEAVANGLPVIDSSLIMWLDPSILLDAQSYVQGDTVMKSLTDVNTVNTSYPTVSLNGSLPYTLLPNRQGYFTSSGGLGGGYISIASSSASYTCPPLMTACVWAYTADWQSPNDSRIMSCTDGGGWSISFSDPGIPAGNIGGQIYAGGYRYVYLPTSAVSAGWHHWAMSWDGRYLKLYLDGVSASSLGYSTGTYDIGSSGNNIRLSGAYLFIFVEAYGSTAEYANRFPGSVGQCLLYNRALSNTEIQTIYNSRAGLYV